MQGTTNQQAYDRGSTIFSPDGRLYQVEYAREAVRRGSASVGVRAADGVVLAARRRVRSPLVEPESVPKLHRVDDGVGVASAGHAADARQLVDVARRTAQRDRLRYGEAMGVEPLTVALADHVQEYTQTGGSRPYGAALLVGGVAGGRPRLFETDPSGTPTEWAATAIGADGDRVRERLEADYDAGLSVDAGVDLAVKALAEADDGPLSADRLAVATVGGEDGFHRFDRERRADRLAALGPGDAAS